MRPALLLLLVGACAGGPVVTGAGTSSDGRTAWFAVTEGDEVRFIRCEQSRCERVPEGEGEHSVEPEPEPREAEPEPEPRPTEEPEDDTEDGPEEERLDMMDGVI